MLGLEREDKHSLNWCNSGLIWWVFPCLSLLKYCLVRFQYHRIETPFSGERFNTFVWCLRQDWSDVEYSLDIIPPCQVSISPHRLQSQKNVLTLSSSVFIRTDQPDLEEYVKGSIFTLNRWRNFKIKFNITSDGSVKTSSRHFNLCDYTHHQNHSILIIMKDNRW